MGLNVKSWCLPAEEGLWQAGSWSGLGPTKVTWEPRGNPTSCCPPAGFPSVRHGHTRLRGSQGLSLDRDGAGLRPPNGALVWGGGRGSPCPLPVSPSTPIPPLPGKARPGARRPP